MFVSTDARACLTKRATPTVPASISPERRVRFRVVSIRRARSRKCAASHLDWLNPLCQMRNRFGIELDRTGDRESICLRDGFGRRQVDSLWGQTPHHEFLPVRGCQPTHHIDRYLADTRSLKRIFRCPARSIRWGIPLGRRPPHLFLGAEAGADGARGPCVAGFTDIRGNTVICTSQITI